MVNVVHDLTIKPREAKYGTRKIIVRNNKRLQVTVPPGVKNGTLVKLTGALRITDGYYGDLYIQIHIDNKLRNISVVSAIVVFTVAIILFAALSNAPSNPAEEISPLSKTLATTVSNTPVPAVSNTPVPNPHFTDNSTIYNGYLTIFHNKQPTDFPNNGKPVYLTENASAIDPTWKELKSFLFLDKTDEKPYIDYFYECASFAEEVHNNAEARGFRSAFVALFFSEEFTGHALNAFFTTDKGLVYIDCSIGIDAVAYIEEEKEYGIVPLQMASSFDYSFYINYHRENILFFKALSEEPQIVDLVYIYW
jgi:hypothetical protein